MTVEYFYLIKSLVNDLHSKKRSIVNHCNAGKLNTTGEETYQENELETSSR